MIPCIPSNLSFSTLGSQEANAASAQGQPNAEDAAEYEERIKDLKEHVAQLREALKKAESDYDAERKKVAELMAMLDRRSDSQDEKCSADMKSLEESNKALKAKLEVSIAYTAHIWR